MLLFPWYDFWHYDVTNRKHLIYPKYNIVQKRTIWEQNKSMETTPFTFNSNLKKQLDVFLTFKVLVEMKNLGNMPFYFHKVLYQN